MTREVASIVWIFPSGGLRLSSGTTIQMLETYPLPSTPLRMSL
jgi:hypothetical protein